MTKTKQKNHHGWEKGGFIMLNSGDVVEIVDDGEYVSTSSSGLWNYRIKFANGLTRIRVPQVGDYSLQEAFEYLDELRDSGETNMYGSPQYLKEDFEIDIELAKKIVTAWMHTFAQRHAHKG